MSSTALKRTFMSALLALGLAACAGDRAPLPDAPPVTPPTAPPTGEPALPPSPDAPAAGAVRIIYDTDFGLDVDDVGALALVHKLADAGELELLGVVSNVRDPYAPAAIDVVNTYYGRPDVPIGLTTAPYYAESYPYWRSRPPRYIKTLAETFPHDTPLDAGTVPSAVGLYRELLAGQPDESVTVVSVGFMQNLAGLMASGPDATSALDGRTLIRRKVKELVIMGGHYPSSTKDIYLTGGREMGPSYAMAVLTDWPTRTVFNTGPVCQDVRNGHTLATATPEANPVRAAYALFNGGEGRMSWDLCSVLYAARGLSGPEGDYFEFRTDERLTLDESGYNAWVAPGNGRHVRLVRVMGDEAMQGLLEAYLVAPPAD